MFIGKVLSTIALVGIAVALLTSSAASVAAQPVSCMLRERHIVGVTPYIVEGPRGPREIHEGRGAVRELRGATVFVQAEPGLTAEWLQLTLTRHVAELHGSAAAKDCAFGVDDIQIKVTSAGTDFGVYLITADPRKAREVLRRARLLVP